MAQKLMMSGGALFILKVMDQKVKINDKMWAAPGCYGFALSGLGIPNIILGFYHYYNLE